MRHFLALLDDALIERVFQPISNALSDHLGVDRRRIAALCIELAAVAWSLSQAPALSAAVLGWQAMPAAGHLVLLLLGLTALLSLRRLFRRIEAGAANPLRLAMQPHRAVLLLLLAARLLAFNGLDLADIADLIMLGLAGFALYLGACSSRPPMRRVAALPMAA